MNTLRVLDQIEVTLQHAPRVPLTGLAFFDADRLLSVLEKVRSTLPEELKQARYLTQENQRIIRQAQEKAEIILAEAKEKAAEKVANSEIIAVAKEQAEAIIETAMQAAKEMRERAEIYAQDLLSGLESELERLTSIVRHGKGKMEKFSDSSLELDAALKQIVA